MLKRPLTRVIGSCAQYVRRILDLVVGPVYSMYSLCTLEISSLGSVVGLHPTYTAKLNTLLRRKFIIEFVPFD